MGFPLSLDLRGRPVYLIGSGPQIEEKAKKIAPFGADIIRQAAFSPEGAARQPALVIVGDTELTEAQLICDLCKAHNIPVNVVDVPQLCSFYFPALITKGDLTVSVSTGGVCPEAAGYLRRRLEEALPDNTEAILVWLAQKREALRKKGCTKAAVAVAFQLGRPLTPEELDALTA